MSTLLVSHRVRVDCGAEIERYARERGVAVELVPLPKDAESRLTDSSCERLEAAFFSEDVFPTFSRQFFSAVRKAPRLRWLHVFNAGVDHPIYTEMLERGVRLTTSAGTASVPIAQTAVTGLLMLAHEFPRWLEAQRSRKWQPMRPPAVPRDLAGQTAIILGIGHIGREIARLLRAFGVQTIGVRRSPLRPDDPVDETHTPDRLPEVASRADWLIVACPLTPETRGIVNREVLARLPRHARVINIARGEIIDEGALTEALRERRLAGAYLDVFHEEPLPASSPLWDMPNVIVTPHNAGAASGNDRRIFELFLTNLERWSRGGALVNEVTQNKGGGS